MSKSSSKRNLIENEVVFREHNENIQKGFDELKKIAKQEGQEHFISQADSKLHFYCECSDENCDKRIVLKSSEYSKIHKDRDKFIIIRGHEAHTIEKVIEQKAEFSVVEKFIDPPESVNGLKTTTVNNT